MVLLSLTFVNSELKGKGCTTLNTEGDELSERLKPYEVGQTVTCFVTKVGVREPSCVMAGKVEKTANTVLMVLVSGSSVNAVPGHPNLTPLLWGRGRE